MLIPYDINKEQGLRCRWVFPLGASTLSPSCRPLLRWDLCLAGQNPWDASAGEEVLRRLAPWGSATLLTNSRFSNCNFCNRAASGAGPLPASYSRAAADGRARAANKGAERGARARGPLARVAPAGGVRRRRARACIPQEAPGARGATSPRLRPPSLPEQSNSWLTGAASAEHESSRRGRPATRATLAPQSAVWLPPSRKSAGAAVHSGAHPARPGRPLSGGFRCKLSGQLFFAERLETSPKVDMDTAAAALPAFVALLLLSPWPFSGVGPRPVLRRWVAEGLRVRRAPDLGLAQGGSLLSRTVGRGLRGGGTQRERGPPTCARWDAGARTARGAGNSSSLRPIVPSGGSPGRRLAGRCGVRAAVLFLGNAELGV